MWQRVKLENGRLRSGCYKNKNFKNDERVVTQNKSRMQAEEL